MKKEIIIDSYGLGHAVAILEHGKIIDCYIDPMKSANFYPPNTFVKAYIDRIAKNIGGYFVKLPNGNQGFLKSKGVYKEGQSVLLQSQVIYELHKAQLFTDSLKIISKYFILKISKVGFSFSKKILNTFDKLKASKLFESKLKNLDDIFVICRSSAAFITFDELNRELEKALEHIQNIKKTVELTDIYFDGLARKVSLEIYDANAYEIVEGTGSFERLGLWDKLEEIKEGRILLNSGSYFIFEQTSAFLTIDVNSGGNLKVSKKDLNLTAVDEISRIIKVLGLGGKILIDFLPCSKELKREIYKNISLSLSRDPVKNKIWGWTKGGIFELERKRDKIPLKLLMEDY